MNICTVLFGLFGHLSATLGHPLRALSLLFARYNGPETPNQGLVQHLNKIFNSLLIKHRGAKLVAQNGGQMAHRSELCGTNTDSRCTAASHVICMF